MNLQHIYVVDNCDGNGGCDYPVQVNSCFISGQCYNTGDSLSLLFPCQVGMSLLIFLMLQAM